jgi:membrane carboxypeptidase/penicillin-binding protein
VIGEFATERRVVIGYDDIAPVLRQAIMATEDADFEQHFGVSISRIAMTAAKDVVTGQRAGASTITQQLARNLFLQASYMRGGIYERSLERKIREAILAVQLERRFTKREIFALYANQVPLHGAYGVEAGARMYFNKSAKDVTLEEAATLAAIIQTPARLSPFVNPERTLARRNNYVLPRMAEEGFITRQAAEKRPRSRSCCASSPRPSAPSPPTSSRTSARRSNSVSAPRRSTRPVSRCRQLWTLDCSAPPSARSIEACGASTSGAASTASRARPCRPPTPRRRPTPTPAGRGPSPPETSCPPW